MSSVPRILFVLNSLGAGGSEIKIIKVANALAECGIEVELAYLSPPRTTLSPVQPAVPVTNLDRHGKISITSIRRLRALVCRGHQVVVAVNLYPLLYVIPVVKWRKLNSVKVVGLVNTADIDGRVRRFGNVFALLLRQCDKVVFGCVAQRMLWIKKYRISSERSLVIYNGVDHQFYSPANGQKEGSLLRARLGIPDGTIIIGSVGRLAPEKNFESVISALSSLELSGRDTYVILAGHGKEQGKLTSMARAKGLENKVVFLGALRDVRPVLSMMDIFVLPSTAVETFSNAALEAMAMARPVVLSDMGGASEMIVHRKSGMLFPVGNTDALIAVLEELHDSSKMRKQLGLAARERVVSSFGPAEMVDRYSNLARVT